MRTTTFLALPPALFVVGCGDAAPTPDTDRIEAPEVAAALDWVDAADAEFGSAPFSPPGWPYRVGDEVDYDTWRQLHKRFPAFLRASAVMLVDGRPFGAVYDYSAGIYKGHFPVKSTYDDYLRARRLRRLGMPLTPLPSGVRLDLALGDRFEASSYAVYDSLDVLRARWHEPFLSRYGRGR